MNQHLKSIIKSVVYEATRYKQETGKDLPRWREKLITYEKEGGYYVHFGLYPKVGINPVNEYPETPTGFYAYPLKAKKISDFGVDRPYAIVFKPKSNVKILNLKDYNHHDLVADKLKLIDFGFYWSQIERASKRAFKKNPGGLIWQITGELVGAEPMNSIDTASSYNEPTDDEPIDEAYHAPAEFSKEEIASLLDRFKKTGIDSYPTYYSYDELDLKKAQALKKASEFFTPEEINELIRLKKLSRPRPIFGNKKIYKILSSYSSRRPSFKMEGGPSNSWKNLLVKLGYDAIVDECEGIIHSNEPCQAVFFKTNMLDIAEIIHITEDDPTRKADALFVKPEKDEMY